VTKKASNTHTRKKSPATAGSTLDRGALHAMRRQALAAHPPAAGPGPGYRAESLFRGEDIEHPQEVLFWTGAGISVPGPSSLPTGWELTERAFRSFFEPDALATILGYHARAGWFTGGLCDEDVLRSARLPRLETVLGVAERHFAKQTGEILGDVVDAQPNWYHEFFAHHIAAGGRHITANFDTCIEKASAHLLSGRTRPQPAAGRSASASTPHPMIEHFHQFLDASTSAGELGSTLARIQGGFGEDLRDRILRAVETARSVVFVGYSGSDFFDVDVAFADLRAGALDGTSVYWIAHSAGCACHEIDPEPAACPPLVLHLRRAGALVRFLCGPSELFLEALARQWSLAVGAPTAASRRVLALTADVAPAGRRVATLELYRELGLPAEVELMLRNAEFDPAAVPLARRADLWQARSEVMWEQGRWSQLRRMWRSVPNGEADPLVRAERIGACLWVQGRLVPAYLWLSRQWRHAEREHGPEMAWPLAETLARVIEHMGRVPGLRLFARLSARRTAARLGEPARRSGLHVYRRHLDLQTSLAALAEGRERAPGSASTSQRWFSEAGSVLASVSYSHRALRDLRAAGGLSAPGELESAYRAHFHTAAAIGTTAGAWRTVLLPDADQVFSSGEALASVFALQYGTIQRFRILARYAAKRSHRRIRHRRKS